MECNRIAIAQGWLFALNIGDAAIAPEYDSSTMRSVCLPHDWQIESARDPEMPGGTMQGFYPREGIGWYRYEFTPDEAWQGKTVRVLFDGVQRFSTVYLNGSEIGGHMYGYVPYEAELTGGLRFGEKNVLVVKVDNSADPQPTGAVISKQAAIDSGMYEGELSREYECAGDRWYSGAGIYRNVWLLIDEPICVRPRGLLITPDSATGDVAIKLLTENRTGDTANVVVSISVTGPDGRAAFARGSLAEITAGNGESEFKITIPKPELWDIETPNLYQMHIKLSASGNALDEVCSSFGFRDAHFDDDKGFFLNGKNIKLYGADLHHDGGSFGAAVPIRVWERRFKALKAIGANAIRCSHNPQCEEFYDLCDRMGFIVIDELYDKWAGTGLYYQRFFMRDRYDDLKRMVYRDYNHPSIVLWSVGNEVDIQYTESFYEILAGLCGECRKLDPTRPVSAALIGFCLRDFNDSTPLEKRLAAGVRYGEIVDVFMGNYMEGFYDALRNAGLHRAFIGSEVFSYYRHEDLQVTSTLARSPWRDVADKDYVAGGFVWAGIDYLGESVGWPNRGWTGCPIDSAGFAKLRAYHLKSQWSAEPMVKIGVFDESEPWDMANRMWGFPQMSDHWNYDCDLKMLHVAVMTNCDYVELYLNDEHKRVGRVDRDGDMLAHFYISFAPGTLRAVGYNDGKPVCEQTLHTARRAERLVLRVCEDSLTADGRDIMHIEAALLDKFGQKYGQSHALVRFRVEGPADIAKVDNGDFLTTNEIFDAEERTLNHGQVLMVLRSRAQPGKIRVTAIAEGFAPAVIELESK